MAKPLRLALIGSFGTSGDQRYRLHQPAAALAQLEGVEVYELHPAPALATPLSSTQFQSLSKGWAVACS